jgi:ferredoxin
MRDLACLAGDALCSGKGACIEHCSADALSLRERAALPHTGSAGAGRKGCGPPAAMP